MNLNKLHIPYFVVKYDLDMYQKKCYAATYKMIQ